MGGILTTKVLRESWDGAFAEGARVEGNLVKDVKLLGRVSKNGRIYSERALSEAARLYDGVHVFFDHVEEPGSARSVRDLAGIVRQPRVAGQEVRGSLQLIGFTEGTVSPATFVTAVAEQMPNAVGMSHIAEGELTPGEGDDLDIVETVTHVHSVDLVINPATTAGLFESLSTEENDMDWKDISLEEFKRRRPDLVEGVQSELAGSEEQKRLREERDALKTKLDAAEAKERLREHKDLVTTKLAEAKLPEQLVTDHFRTQLEEAKDEAAVDALIEDRKELAKGVTTSSGGPRSGERTVEEHFERDRDSEPLTEEAFAEAAPGGAKSLFI